MLNLQHILRDICKGCNKLVTSFLFLAFEVSFVEVHRREEMLLMPVETAALIQVIQALVPRDVLVVKPSANANGAANFATLLRRQKNLRLVTL